MGGSQSLADCEQLPVGKRTLVVQRLLGRGSYGKVHYVEDLDSKAGYALKALEKRHLLAKGEKAVSGAIIEKNLLSQHQHPMLVNLRAASQSVDTCYMLLDFMGGGDLAYHLDTITAHKFTADTVQFYAAGLLLALQYLHKNGIIHRDLKPENIMLDSDGYPHLTDFNVAVSVKEGEKTNGFAGTLPYMAPEVHERKDYATEVDIWSLGIVLYECSCGRTPWGLRMGENTEAWISNEDSNAVIEKSPLKGQPKKEELAKRIIRGKVKMPKSFDKTFCSFLSGIFVAADTRPTATALKSTHYLEDFNWSEFEAQKLKAPFLPRQDRANVDGTLALQQAFGGSGKSEKKKRPLTDEDQVLFKGWDWVPDSFMVEPSTDNEALRKSKHKKAKRRTR